MKSYIIYLIKICFYSFGFICVSNKISLAQVSSDNTVNTQVNQNGNVVEITGGETRGSNLFHSFQEFSVSTGNEAFFNNGSAIANIFSRVTGNTVSQIDGLIRANGSADLFLINPAGIIFNENASLDIGGSFLATTANSIQFNDGEFSAIAPEEKPILTISVPIGLSFEENPGEIINNSVANERRGLEVADGNNITLLGGNVSFEGGGITAPGGRVNLGGLSAAATVSIAEDGNLTFPEDLAKADLSLESGIVDVTGSGGSININAGNVDIFSGSNIQAGIDANSQFSGIPAEDITLDASGNINLDNSRIANEIYEEGIGNGGNVKITGRSVFLNNGAIISTNSFGQGNTGEIIINASNTFSYDGTGNSEETVISATLLGTGSGGQIAINAPKVSLLEGATIVAHSFGRGNAGSIKISASDNVVISDTNSGIGSQVFADAVGNGGTITVDAPKLSVLNGATIVAHTDAQGNAGDITVNAKEVFLDGVGSNGGSGIGSAAFELAIGNGGAIVINTDSLNVTNGATLLVSNFGKKDAGSVKIKATGAVSFDGIGTNGYSSSAFSTVEAGSNGNGGEIKITANSLTVNSGAVIGASTSGQGRGGDINLDVDTLQVQSGGQILTTSRGSGDAGNIFINTTENTIITGSDPTFLERLARIGRPVIRNEGAASGIFANTDATSTGSGGNINISTQNLSVSDDARINAANQGNGVAGNTGGNINLQIVDGIILKDNSYISAQALKDADGGNLNIDTEFIVALPDGNNNILASAELGRGGNITINVKGLFIAPNNLITASSDLGIDGTVQINTPDINFQKELEQSELEILTAEKAIANSCLANNSQQASFTVGGNGGLPKSPSSNYSDANFSLTGVGSLPSIPEKAVPTQRDQNQALIPAEKMVETEDGRIFLVTAPQKAKSLFCSPTKAEKG